MGIKKGEGVGILGERGHPPIKGGEVSKRKKKKKKRTRNRGDSKKNVPKRMGAWHKPIGGEYWK